MSDKDEKITRARTAIFSVTLEDISQHYLELYLKNIKNDEVLKGRKDETSRNYKQTQKIFSKWNFSDGGRRGSNWTLYVRDRKLQRKYAQSVKITHLPTKTYFQHGLFVRI